MKFLSFRPARGPLLAATVTALLLGPGAAAAEWYRYVNNEGVTVLSHTVPPELVYKGYQVIDREGRVVRVVERQATVAEIAQREAAEQEQLARHRRDEELLILYASPEEVQLARQRRLASIENSVTVGTANLARLQAHKRQLESQAATRERSGQPPSQELIEAIRIVELQVREAEREIAAREREQEQAAEQFDSDYVRTRELYGRLASD
jgi:hypothetical protein